MNTTEEIVAAPASPPDHVAELLLRIARRADMIAAAPGGRCDRSAWLRAEFEVFECEERKRPLTLWLEDAA